MIKHKLLNIFYIIFFALFTFCLFLVFYTKLPEIVDEKIYDFITSAKFKKLPANSNTLIVKIDDKSIEQIGQWPWSRIVISEIVNNISKSHPASLGLDIIFAEKDRTSPQNFEKFYKSNLGIDADLSSIPKNMQDNDAIFANQVSKRNIVTSIIASNRQAQSSCIPKNALKSEGNFLDIPEAVLFTCNTQTIQSKSKNYGFINVSPSLDGLLRKYSIAYRYDNKLIPSLGVAMLKSVDSSITFKKSKVPFGGYKTEFLKRNIFSNEKGEVLNYLHSSKKFKSVSAVDVLQDDFNKSLLMGKFIIFGSTAMGLSDFYVTQDEEKISGLYSHASFIENVLNGNLLYTPQNTKILAYIICIFLLLIISYFILKKRYIEASLTCFISAAVATVATWFFMSYGIYFPLGFFLTPLIISYFLILFFLSYILEKEENEFSNQLIEIRSSITSNMMMMIESRDTETGKHIVRTREYAKILATYLYKYTPYKDLLSEEAIDIIYQATPLHDIGKIGIPDKILKKPAKLLESEMDIMKTHAKIGHDIISKSIKDDKFSNLFLEIASNISYTHHERWDGTGYPRGLKGSEIPLEGRIIALVDVYDALTSARCYKSAFEFDESEQIIKNGNGTHFDPTIVEAFIRVKEKFKEVALENTD